MPTKSFSYLKPKQYYFDAACQSLRPEKVLHDVVDYYTQYNACGGRGNYPWAESVDAMVEQTRQMLLEYLGKSSEEYTVVFTLNTTYAINLFLSGIRGEVVQQIVTTHKEHNSVWLPAIQWSKQYARGLMVLSRDQENNVDVQPLEVLERVLFLAASHSNVDGQGIANLSEVVRKVKRKGGLVAIDACQSLAHTPLEYEQLDFDVLFGSGHKLYAPTLGFMVIKYDVLKSLDISWVGGGSVAHVNGTEFERISNHEDLHSRLEFGLQNYAAIIGLKAALQWILNFNPVDEYPTIEEYNELFLRFEKRYSHLGIRKKSLGYLSNLADFLFLHMQRLANEKRLFLLNSEPSTIVSFTPLSRTAYEITQTLGGRGIMCRSGFMCAHHYIQESLGVGPLVRISLGLHNTIDDISELISTLDEIL